MSKPRRKAFAPADIPKGSKAVLDTCVLYGSFSRYVLLYLVEFGYLVPLVSDEILREMRNSLGRKPSLTEQDVIDICHFVRRQFSTKGQMVVFYASHWQRIDDLAKSNRPEDKCSATDAHVLYLGRNWGCYAIITDNLEDFPASDKSLQIFNVDSLLFGMLSRKGVHAKMAKRALGYAAMMLGFFDAKELEIYIDERLHFPQLLTVLHHYRREIEKLAERFDYINGDLMGKYG